MLNNLTNFFNLIAGKLIKKTPESTDLIALGTKNVNFGGGYRPTGILYSDLKADILKDASGAACGTQFGLNWASVGPKVSFKKKNYATGERDIIIPNELELARKNNQGLFNAPIESGWDGNVSPADTEWNSIYTDAVNNGWGNLADVATRTFDVFQDSVNGDIGCNIVGLDLVMRHIPSGRLWIIKFTEWTANNNGGGFAYDRYEIFPEVNFYRAPQNPATVDIVSEGLIIKRDNVRGLYNSVLESEYDNNCDNSPLGTEWNSIYTDSTNYGFTNLANVRNRKFGTWREAVNANPLNAFNDGIEMIMHDLSTDLYWTVIFTEWGSGEGGGYGEFGYIRQLIPQDCGIKFNDGTVMTTAVTAGGTTCCPVLDAEGNLVIDDNSTNTVNVGPGGTQFIPNFSGFLLVNDHFDGGLETWIAGGGDTICIGATNTGGGPVGSSLYISGTGYMWQNDSNMTGPFTFTVIKTRNEA